MTAGVRPLAGITVNLSVSESGDSLRRGFPSWQVNRVTLHFIAALFGQGAAAVFGHDWREDGVMEAVHGFALQMQSLAMGEDAAAPLLRNLLPWPDVPRLSQPEREQLSTTLVVETAGLPEELRPFDERARTAGPGDTVYDYLRARGLTFLRHKLNGACDARICIGGRTSGSQGRYPGVVEEALLALRRRKPLYLAGLLGGAAEQIADAVEGAKMPDAFCERGNVERLYKELSAAEQDVHSRADRTIDPAAVWREFSDAGRESISETNGLSVRENDELMRTPAVERAIELVLIGLSRIRRRQRVS